MTKSLYSWLFTCSLAFIASCGGGDDPKLAPLDVTSVSIDRGQLLDAETESAAPTHALGRNYVFSELTTRVPVGITVRSATDGFVKVNGRLVPTNQSVATPIAEISVSSVIQVEYLNAVGISTSFELRKLPAGFPDFDSFGRLSVEGEVLLTSGGGGMKYYLLSLDASGKVIYYKREPSLQYSDFKKYRFGEKEFYAYLVGERIMPIGYAEGKVVIMDSTFRTASVIDGLLPNAAKGRPLVQSENHDFMMLGEDHYVLSGYYGHERVGPPAVSGTAKVVDSVLQEVKNGAVVFEWDSADHPELYAQSEEGNSFVPDAWSDYAHFNSFEVDPKDGNLVVSFRNLNAILKIRRPDGAILWSYGGVADSFQLTALQHPQGQHSAKLRKDGSLIFFDNNTTCIGVGPALSRFHTPDPFASNQTMCQLRGASSRVVAVKLDEQAKVVTSFKEWRFPNASGSSPGAVGQQATSYRGSVQELPTGNLLVGFGSNPAAERDAVEWDPVSGAPVFELYFDHMGKHSAQADVGSYRVNFAP